jgi:hypothetical protein
MQNQEVTTRIASELCILHSAFFIHFFLVAAAFFAAWERPRAPFVRAAFRAAADRSAAVRCRAADRANRDSARFVVA